MRIAVSSFGSEGDIRPFVALTRALRRAGHDAFLCAAELFRERTDQAGIPLASTGPLRDEEGMRSGLQRVMRQRNPVTGAKIIFEIAANEMKGRLAPLVEATKGVDLIVHHVIDVGAFAAAGVHGVRRISASLSPGIWINRVATIDGGEYGALVNSAMGMLFRQVFPFMTDRYFRGVIDAAGLPGPRKGIILECAESPLLNLMAVSPSMVPPDPRWPATRLQTGYWFLDLPDYQPPPELRAFMDEGEPPLVIGFGSMAGVDSKSQTEAVLGAVAKLGKRAVLLAGWSELGQGALPKHVFAAQHVPHDWLYPRASVVVHHGGAGTTAAVTRAGVPQVVVWHMGDQPTWGKLVERRGLASKALYHQKLTAEALAERIASVDRPRIRTAAKAMGERLRAEDGLGAAVNAIESAVARA